MAALTVKLEPATGNRHPFPNTNRIETVQLKKDQQT